MILIIEIFIVSCLIFLWATIQTLYVESKKDLNKWFDSWVKYGSLVDWYEYRRRKYEVLGLKIAFVIYILIIIQFSYIAYDEYITGSYLL